MKPVRTRDALYVLGFLLFVVGALIGGTGAAILALSGMVIFVATGLGWIGGDV